ncbi:hypothetical protein [Actinopolymorpha alba]|uniref:hypothetical protein n=1 Tax=Actinopolymorpha alba TaxID=533267 RepID=UPI00036DAFC2|nr:hypothetical protein [Actinopolymorpha alba]
MASSRAIARALIERHGTTYAEQAGIRLGDAPEPLYQLLVLATLLSARISTAIAVASAAELFAAGYQSARTMSDAAWEDRVEALDRAGYVRYDFRTSTMLGNGATLLLERWAGDLRRLHQEGRDVDGITRLLREFPGIGPVGASIFCREVQGVWPDLAPYVDQRTLLGAERLGLPTTAVDLAALVDPPDVVRLVAGCVRASLSEDVVEDVRNAV